MNTRTKNYRKAHNIERRNTPKTKDGARRKDKTEGVPTMFRRYRDNHSS